MSRKRTLPATDSAISSPESEGGVSHSGTQDGQTDGRSGLEAVPASPSPQRESKKGKPTNGTCGPSSPASFASADLQSYLESRLKTRFGTGGSIEYSETWKERVTPAGRRYLAHIASARRTLDSDCTGWPSPLAHDGRRQCGGVGSTNGASLSRDAMRWLTGWPTPNAMAGGSTSRSKDRKDELLIGGLVQGLSGWGTPTSNDKVRSEEFLRGREPTPREALAGWVSPTARDHSMGVPPPRATDTGIPLSQQVSGATIPSSVVATAKPAALVLNPAMSRWLMAFPSSWDQVSPHFAAWQKMQDVIASDASEPTETR